MTDLRELADRMEIQQVVLRYCRGIDRADGELLAGVYHDDAIDDHGPWRFTDAKRELPAFALPRLEAMDGVPQHHITNCLIEVAGDRAVAESYFLAVQPGEAAESTPLNVIGGRYLDRFERREGRWAIAERTVVNDWSRVVASGAEWPPTADHARGARREADPSYALFAALA